ncbi:OLC1v1038691C1 [Oldenlandia corymbosa var. corymbosa]|uniref:OLC1v1038691C1 n=1 Tax=Oldenlandia corymbosa var. corymbosa TaxID=529605 RepID=A0AAV1D0C1_OLDCO|nr:OLC1v1038691C1 [Oldenlandia corymbosa var. corymbosa]
MAVKLSSLTLLRRISKRVCLQTSFSSISCANTIHIDPETDKDLPNGFDFESKIEFLRNKLHPESLVHVLDSTTDVNSSLKLFKWASLQKKFEHNVKTYYLMILKLGMAGDVEEMECFCNELIKEKHSGFDSALSTVIDTFGKNYRFDEALRVLACLNSSSIKPSIGVFNGLMGALVQGKRDFKDVLFVYKEMVKVGILPNVETLNYLLEALFEDDRVDTAVDQYRRMNKKGCSPNSRTFEVVIGGLIAKERVDESLGILDEMLEHECEVDMGFYDRITPSLCLMNKHVAILRLIAMMKSSKVFPNSSTYRVMIQCLCRNLCVDDAVSLFEVMVSGGVSPDNDTYKDIIDGLCKLNKFSEAKKILLENNVEISCPFNLLLGAYCKVGDLAAAKDLFDEMFDRGLTDRLSWNLLILCLGETGRIKEASEVLCRMIIASFVPNSATYSALIMGKCKHDELGDALLLFHQIKSKGQVLESASYAELVKCLSLKGKIQEAAEVFCYMSSKKICLQSSIFDLLIKGVCETEEFNCAMRFLILADYSGSSISSATYIRMMRCLLKFGKLDHLLMVLSRMIVDGCPIEEDAYCIFVQCKSATNSPEQCTKFLNLMLNKGLLPDSETVTSVLSCLSKHSQLHMILWTIDKLISCSDVLNSLTYNMLVSGLCKEGYRDVACRMLDVMLGKGWIPNAETHQLLLGSDPVEKSELQTNVDEFPPTSHDEVSCILAEALAQT